MFNDLMENIEWFFNLHDNDKDGSLTKDELLKLSESLLVSACLVCNLSVLTCSVIEVYIPIRGGRMRISLFRRKPLGFRRLRQPFGIFVIHLISLNQIRMPGGLTLLDLSTVDCLRSEVSSPRLRPLLLGAKHLRIQKHSS